ncbi:MAG: hypothetical protein NTY80_00845 [candidate division SR1 bacterium]|nr:hypothetical protein [candidate division SR1 bacterium]
MNGLELNTIVSDAIEAKNKSTEAVFSEVLQTEITSCLLRISNLTGKTLNKLSPLEELPEDLRIAALRLRESHTL